MKKIFLPLLALCGMVTGLTLTSCGGGGGSNVNGPARAFQNLTITCAVGLQDFVFECYQANGARTLASSTILDSTTHGGTATISKVEQVGNDYKVTISFSYEASSEFINDENVQSALGNAGADGDDINVNSLVYFALILPITAEGDLVDEGAKICLSIHQPQQEEEVEDETENDGYIELDATPELLGRVKTEHLK